MKKSKNILSLILCLVLLFTNITYVSAQSLVPNKTPYNLLKEINLIKDPIERTKMLDKYFPIVEETYYCALPSSGSERNMLKANHSLECKVEIRRTWLDGKWDIDSKGINWESALTTLIGIGAGFFKKVVWITEAIIVELSNQVGCNISDVKTRTKLKNIYTKNSGRFYMKAIKIYNPELGMYIDYANSQSRLNRLESITDIMIPDPDYPGEMMSYSKIHDHGYISREYAPHYKDDDFLKEKAREAYPYTNYSETFTDDGCTKELLQ